MGEYQPFPSKIFCLTVPIISQMNPSVLCFRKFPVAKNLWIRGGGEYQDFPLEIFFLTVQKIFEGESFTVAVFLGTGKVWIRWGSVKIFRRKHFVSQSRNFL